MWKILQNVCESLIVGSQNTFPNEFVSLLGGNKDLQIADELIIVLAQSGKRHANLFTDMLPFNQPVIGSVHSHPGHSNQPSLADARLFSRFGPFHLIICQPFSLQTMAAYDAKARRIDFEVIDTKE